jgi:DNA-directed RNA polymerase specialized sigma24 family protein
VDKDNETFQALVDEHGATVLAMLRRLCRNPHDADDLFQDVAVRVWRNLGSRPVLRNPRAWLLTIAYRVYVVVSVGIWLKSRPVYLKTSPTVVTVVDAKVARASSLREVEEIRTGVVALIGELDQLRREADLLDARRDADALELRFAPRTALNDF